MAYNKQKLLRFKESILKNIDFKISKIKEKSLNYEKTELEATENQKLNELFNLMQSKVKNLNSQYRKKFNQVELELKTEILFHRNRLINQVYNDCRNELLKFNQTKSYPLLLIKFLKIDCGKFNLDKSTLFIKSDDLKFKPDFLNIAKFKEIEIDTTNNLGGYKIILNGGKILIDRTLSTLFNSAFENFYKNCDLNLTYVEKRANSND